eukprot:scaffold7109_cov63-Phaeocystis_antarctica.AAC.5
MPRRGLRHVLSGSFASAYLVRVGARARARARVRLGLGFRVRVRVRVRWGTLGLGLGLGLGLAYRLHSRMVSSKSSKRKRASPSMPDCSLSATC